MVRLKNFEVKLYLEAWVYNVGFASSPEKTLMFAMRSTNNLKDWFKSGEVDYDDEYALKLINELYEEEQAEAQDE